MMHYFVKGKQQQLFLYVLGLNEDFKMAGLKETKLACEMIT